MEIIARFTYSTVPSCGPREPCYNGAWLYLGLGKIGANPSVVRLENVYYILFKKNPNLLFRKQEFINKGVEYINDLLDEYGLFLTYESFTLKYSIKINFLDYNSLITQFL